MTLEKFVTSFKKKKEEKRNIRKKLKIWEIKKIQQIGHLRKSENVITLVMLF